jgi:hypothetical protein
MIDVDTLKRDVQQTVTYLNKLLSVAYENGLKIETSVFEKNSVQQSWPLPILDVRLFQEIK